MKNTKAIQEGPTDAEYLRIIKNTEASKDERDKCTADLYKRYIPLIKKMARKFNLSREDSEDFLSESFFTVLNVIGYTDMDKIDDNYSFGYFLRFHLMNMGIRGVKKSVRRGNTIGNKVSWDAITDEGFTPQEMAIQEEDALAECEAFNEMSQVKSALGRLSDSIVTPRDKRIMKKALEGYSCHEIADMFGLSHMRITKIRRQVADILHSEIKEFAH